MKETQKDERHIQDLTEEDTYSKTERLSEVDALYLFDTILKFEVNSMCLKAIS